MKILVVDDHTVVRQGVQRLLSTIDGAVIREAESAEAATAAFRAEPPDVVVLDINLKDGSGLDLLRRFKTEAPDARIVVFSMYSDAVYATSARRAGALGYVSKSAPSDELITAVERAARGEAYVDSEIAGLLATSPFEGGEALRSLTHRELEILTLLGDGESIAAIADKLGVAYKTVANTCTRIKEKLKMERTGDLIRFAVENRHTRARLEGRGG